MALEQFGADFGDQVEFAVLVLGVGVSDFDAAHHGVPAGGEHKASVVREVEVLDEVSVFALSLNKFAEVARALIGVDDCQGLVSGGTYQELQRFECLRDFQAGHCILMCSNFFYKIY